ncbi:ankyrin, partial [Zopfia rhizophila CBS 207.26]
HGDTALHIAATFDHVDTASAILDSGIDPDILDNQGYTALSIAAKYNRAALVKALISKGANIHRRSPQDETPLTTAVLH